MAVTFQPETQALIDFLATIEPGTTVTYREVEQRVGYAVTSSAGRARLTTARNVLMRDKQLVFGTVMGVGIKALSDVEKVGRSSDSLSRVRRAAKRTRCLTLSVKDYEALPPAEKSQHQAVTAIAAAIEAVASAPAVVAIATAKPLELPSFPALIEAIRPKTSQPGV